MKEKEREKQKMSRGRNGRSRNCEEEGKGEAEDVEEKLEDIGNGWLQDEVRKNCGGWQYCEDGVGCA